MWVKALIHYIIDFNVQTGKVIDMCGLQLRKHLIVGYFIILPEKKEIGFKKYE